MESDELKLLIDELVAEFHSQGPFDSSFEPEAAVEAIEGYRARIVPMREQESALSKGLVVFRIELQPSVEIAKLETVSLFYLFLTCCPIIMVFRRFKHC